jgi:hypothetical protein
MTVLNSSNDNGARASASNSRPLRQLFILEAKCPIVTCICEKMHRCAKELTGLLYGTFSGLSVLRYGLSWTTGGHAWSDTRRRAVRSEGSGDRSRENFGLRAIKEIKARLAWHGDGMATVSRFACRTRIPGLGRSDCSARASSLRPGDAISSRPERPLFLRDRLRLCAHRQFGAGSFNFARFR